MKRSGFRPRQPAREQRDRSGEFESFELERPSARMAEMIQNEVPAPVPKDTPHYSAAWRRAVASIPTCVLCRGAKYVVSVPGVDGTQAAHRNESKGMGMKTDDCLTAALCPTCHREIDQGKNMTRAERRAEIDRAIVLTLRELFRAGKVQVVT